jgi:thymidylate kinase
MCFLAVGGLDSAGKSTQVANLVDLFRAQGVPSRVLWSRGGYTSGFSALKRLARRLRPALLPPPGPSPRRQAAMGRPWVRRLWLALAILDLSWLYGVRVRWWRWRRQAVICDRYLWDTLVDFQLYYPAERVEHQPDVSFLLVLPVAESLRRSRLKREPFPEGEGMRRLRFEHYRQLQADGRWSAVIDASRSEDEVRADIQSKLPDPWC